MINHIALISYGVIPFNFKSSFLKQLTTHFSDCMSDPHVDLYSNKFLNPLLC